MSVAVKSTLDTPLRGRGLLSPFGLSHLVLLSIKAMRPRQWLKNLFVLAPILFTGKITELHLLMRALAAVGCFCGMSGGIYLINDLCDRRRDVLHPIKRLRPIASGALPPWAAALAAGLVLVSSLSSAAVLDTAFLLLAVVYLILMLAYCLGLKNVVLADVLCIAAGFVLRAVAGGAVVAVPISQWLFICTALVSLFMALGKRRHEISRLQEKAVGHRPVLDKYNQPLLDQMISITTTTCLVSYLLYCVMSETAQAHSGLLLTAPIVAYGLFRYLYCMYCKGAGGSPEDIVLKDPVFLATGITYGLAVFVVLYLL
jgi:4-hydroxybenzoate polyprenyltransferase